KRLETEEAAGKPRRDAQEAWVEVARLKRRLQIAERDPRSLIVDEELRRRCADLLAAEGDYDRVIREACVVLEDRVRVTIGADHSVVGTPLMERAFGKSGPLQLSNVEQEQTGAMQFYRGTMAFFRNAAGHRLSDTYTQEDVLRYVAWVDLLLKMVSTARPCGQRP
ncbi:MAG: TIGR02391 family protein, partial [Chloroflexota bacterium]